MQHPLLRLGEVTGRWRGGEGPGEQMSQPTSTQPTINAFLTESGTDFRENERKAVFNKLNKTIMFITIIC